MAENYQDTENTVGIDVRTSLELKTNPAEGALHIPLDEVGQSSSKLPQDKGTPIFIFCEAGGRAETAKNQLKAMGYENVTNIGDWRTWNKLKTGPQ